MNADQRGNIILLAGTSHKELALLVANRLGITLGQCRVGQNTARETLVEIIESVRGKDVYILQTGTRNVNNDIMEMLIMCYALKTSCARSITGVIPYLPYGRQSRMRLRSCIVSKLMAKMMTKAGFTHILTVDLRSKEMQGFFDIPVDNLRALGFLIAFLQKEIPELTTQGCIVAKDAHATQKATSFSERLKLPLAVIHGRQKESDDSEDLDRAPSPPPYAIAGRSFELNCLPQVQQKSRLPMTVVGEVSGKICIIVDDSIEEIEPFCTAAELLRVAGAKKVYVCCTHGIFPSDAATTLSNRAVIDEVIVTNTVPLDLQKNVSSKIKTVDVSMLLAEAIRRIHYCESMSYMYRNVTDGD